MANVAAAKPKNKTMRFLLFFMYQEKKDNDEHVSNNNHRELALVSIRDTGKGIDAAIEDKLFEKFETKSEKGIGLGLYISRKIIEAHGGKIWAENNKDGNGATFSFSLPLDKQ